MYRISILNRIYIVYFVYFLIRYASCKLTSVLNYYCTHVHSRTGARKAVSGVLRATDAHTMRAHKHNGWQRLSDY